MLESEEWNNLSIPLTYSQTVSEENQETGVINLYHEQMIQLLI